jgi:hypothetical protein
MANGPNPPPPAPNPPGPNPPAPNPPAPKLILITGLIFGAVTLAYFMALSLLPVAGYPIPCDARFPAVIVLAICAAFATGFLGSYATINGQIPLPFLQQFPIGVNAGGGAAVLVIILLVGYYLYAADCNTSVKGAIQNVTVQDNGTDKILIVKFDSPKLPTGYVSRIEAAYDKDFKSRAIYEGIDQPDTGRVDVFLKPPARWPVWVRLVAFDTSRNAAVPSLSSDAFQVDNPNP